LRVFCEGFHYVPFILGGSLVCQLLGLAVFYLDFSFARKQLTHHAHVLAMRVF
jgi:hypothetical protein